MTNGCLGRLRKQCDMRNDTGQSFATYPRPEPRPDWSVAKRHWSWTWQLHTYGFALLFLLLGAYVLVITWHIRKRLRVQHHVLALMVVLLVLCASRSLYLLLDPYESKRCVPVAIERVLYDVVFPCLTSSFSLIQVVFMRVTRSSGGHRKLRRYRLLGAVITSHFTIVVVVDVTVAYRPSLKLLALLCQSIYVIANIVLCFSFVYNGLKVAQFTDEANRALKQLIAYGRLRRSVMQQGNRREMALHRISKPRIRPISEMQMPASDDASDSASTSSSGGDVVYLNGARLVFGDEHMARTYRNNGHNGSMPGTNALFAHLNLISSPSPLRTRIATDSFYEVSDSDSDLTSKEDNNLTEATTVTDISQRNSCSSMTRLVASQTGQRLLPNGDGVRASSDNSYVNGALQCHADTEHAGGDHVYSTCYVIPSDVTPLPESGYVADNEYSSPKAKTKTKKSKSKDTTAVRDDTTNMGSPVREPFTLPSSDGSFGLHRIRQGSVLRTALRITYVTTAFSCVSAVLQTYAMFGVYGVLSNEHVAEPWPWYAYQTCMR